MRANPKRNKGAGKPGRRVKVVPYAVPLSRLRPEYVGLTVPTRWIKFVFGLFLLPFCAALTRTFFMTFARATIAQHLWMAEPFWFFSLGAVLWLIIFFGLPRPVIVYVFGHELTHALTVLLLGGRVSGFHISREGGHIVTNRTNFFIALAPYFFPIYSILAIAIYGTASLFYHTQSYGRVLYGVIGGTWAFHFTFSVWMITKNQSDLTDHGTFFSLVVIYLINLVLISVLLVLASPLITFAAFGADLLDSLSNFSDWTVYLFETFRRGVQS